jgi:hypothetical protein
LTRFFAGGSLLRTEDGNAALRTYFAKAEDVCVASTGAEGTDNDTLVIDTANAFTVGGNLNVAFIGSFSSPVPNGGYIYTIVDATAAGSVNGTFASLNGVAGGTSYSSGSFAYTVEYGSNEIQLDVTSVTPEPTSLGILALGGVAMLRRRRRSIIQIAK